MCEWWPFIIMMNTIKKAIYFLALCGVVLSHLIAF